MHNNIFYNFKARLHLHLVHMSRRLKCTIVITRCPSLTFHIFDFSTETAEQNSTKLDRKQDLNVIYQVCVIRADRKNKMASRPLIGLDIFYFSSETAERNSTKLDKKLDPNVLHQVCVFRTDRKIKMTAPPLICWDIFHVSETTERNTTKLHRKQSLNILYQVCVFRADWQIHFGLLHLLNRLNPDHVE